MRDRSISRVECGYWTGVQVRATLGSVRVFRFDRQTQSERTRLPHGAIRLTGELTKSGVFEYTDASGQKIREYRPPEEVSKSDSLATIEDAPVTIGHPPLGVTAESFGKLAAGHARGAAAQTDARGAVMVRGSLVAARKDAVEGLNSGKLTETSMGYSCRVDATPGVTPDGQAYDRVQRDIVYNHVALLPAGHARLGTRLDGAADIVPRLDAAGNQIPDTQEELNPMKVTIKKDGKDLEVESGSPEHVSYLQATADAAMARADAAELELVKFREDAAKAERAKLEATAASVLGKEFKADGQTDRQVREAVIAKRLPAVKCDGKDDVYVGAMFDAAMAVTPAPAPKTPVKPNALVKALASAGRKDAAKDGGESGEDDEESEPFKKAADMKKKADSAWERG